ncbi:MAG: 50S ribosomal protein L17 [Chlamydiia bacterium]|nr:50S ribosomal protein L17 [Chlamydiia bacterium]
MRHRKNKTKLNRTTEHKKALMRNLSKELIQKGTISTTKAKAKELQKVFEPLVTLAKEDTLHARRQVISKLGLHYNSLTPKQARAAKAGDTSMYNIDRVVIDKLFKEIGPRYKERAGGYTRVVLSSRRVGDGAETCFIECV